MQLPVSDVDFYERKIFRLEKDIACLNQQLNAAKFRLRSAEDFQIKYELLLRQSQQENIRVKKIQQAERIRFNEIMVEQIDKVNKQWILKIQDMQESIKQQWSEQKQALIKQIDELSKKNKQMNEKSQQMDVLLFKNKKIAKDLESLEDIIEQTRINNERQRQEDTRVCKENITKKFQERMKKEKSNYEQIINDLQQQIERLQTQLMKSGLVSRQTAKNSERSPNEVKQIQQNLNKVLREQIQKLKNALKQKNDIIEEIQQAKIQQEQKHSNQMRQMKLYQQELEQKIFEMQTTHQAEIFNLKNRMEEVRRQQLIQKQKECEIIEKQHMKQNQLLNQKILKQKAELQQIKKLEEAEIAKLKQDKEKLQKKIIQLKNRLNQFENQQQAGETINLINSMKHGDKKQDDQSNYQNGVTFLERQLKKVNIKLEKKNLQIANLVTKLNNSSSQFQKQLAQTKHKYNGEIKQLNEKINGLDEEIKDRNHQLRQVIKQFRDKETDYEAKLDQLTADNRSLQNLTNNLQRDYNRILESKKLIEKSFREQRERSITSKSQIAMAKKQKWIELERQKNQIQIIYKEKQEQFKTNAEVIESQLRVQNDKLQRQKDLLEQDLKILKERLKQNGKVQSQKQNIQSQYHKKLATVNLEIALTQNLYHSLMKAKSRVKKTNLPQQKPEDRPKHQKSQSQQVVNKVQGDSKKQKQKKQDQKSVGKQLPQGALFNREYDNISSEQSNKIVSSIGHQSQQPMYLDEDDRLGSEKSPTFPMQFSFNPKFM